MTKPTSQFSVSWHKGEPELKGGAGVERMKGGQWRERRQAKISTLLTWRYLHPLLAYAGRDPKACPPRLGELRSRLQETFLLFNLPRCWGFVPKEPSHFHLIPVSNSHGTRAIANSPFGHFPGLGFSFIEQHSFLVSLSWCPLGLGASSDLINSHGAGSSSINSLLMHSFFSEIFCVLVQVWSETC